MKMKQIILLVGLILIFAGTLFAGGQKDLTEKPAGMGLLVIGNEGKLSAVDGIKWTYEIVYINNSDGNEYSINIPELKNKIDFYYLPPGKYKALKSLPHHFSGSEYINEEGFDITDNDEINYDFEIKENEITLFNYFLYKFNNKKKSGQDVMVDVEDYVLPKDFINGYGSSNNLYRWDYNPETIQYTFFLTIDVNIEKKILENLLLVEGASQWLYSPEFKANTAYWTNIPAPEEEVIEIVETPPWTSPELSPSGDLYILSIGIDSYADTSLTLSGSGASAIEFSDFITENESDNYKNIHVETISDIFVPKSLILEKVDEISTLAGTEDTTIIYISSHGISDIKGRPFILASDGDMSNITSTCLAFRTFQMHLSKNKGLVLAVMDVGRTGSWSDGREAFFSFNPDNLILKNNMEIPLGLYSVSSGSFINTDSYSFPDLLKETISNNGNALISDGELWSEYIPYNNPNGVWSNSSAYTAVLKDRGITRLARTEFLVELTKVVNTGDEEDALNFISLKEQELHFSQDYLDILRESIKAYY